MRAPSWGVLLRESRVSLNASAVQHPAAHAIRTFDHSVLRTDGGFAAPVSPQSQDGVAAGNGWHAALELGFESCAGRSVLRTRRHAGPLRVQKALYPEGDCVCHAIVVHPPGGIVGGDRLEIQVTLGAGAHALITTPGATKWYCSAGDCAVQHVGIRVDAGAAMEWLPLETIVFDGARAAQHIDIDLQPGARYIGWEMTCLGRTASGERFTQGSFTQRLALRMNGKPLFLEFARIEGGSPILQSAAGLAGRSVSATMLVASARSERDLIAALREVAVRDGDLAGVTQVSAAPAVLVARYLGGSAQAARAYFSALWQLARPAVLGRDAVSPRIWSC